MSAPPTRVWLRPRHVIALAVALLVVPALIDVFLSKGHRSFGYLAADAFYYFTVARNVVEHGAFAFDQTHVTNAFHPLWQWLTVGMYAVVHVVGADPLVLAELAVVFGLLLIAVALVLLGNLLTRDGRLNASFILIPVGAFGLLVAPVYMAFWRAPPRGELFNGGFPLFGTLYTYANGVESSAVILGFALIAWLHVRRPPITRRLAVIYGLACCGLALARLDHAIFSLAYLVGAFAPQLFNPERSQRREAFLRTFAGLLAFGLPFAAYLLANVISAGSAVPVSGSEKSSLPFITTSNYDSVLAIFMDRPTTWIRDFIREAQLLIPAVAAVAYLPFAFRGRCTRGAFVVRLRRPADKFSAFMLLTAASVWGLSFYNFFFVPRFGIGHWYAPVSTLFVSLFAVEAASRLPERLLRWGRPATLAAAAAACVVTLAVFVKLHRIVNYNFIFADFCHNKAPAVMAHYRDAPPKVVDLEDGIIAFATGFPAMSGQKLAVDKAALDDARKIGWPKVVSDRGFHRFAAVYYIDGNGLRVGDRSERVRLFANAVLKSQNLNWDFEVEYVDGRFAIVRANKPPR